MRPGLLRPWLVVGLLAASVSASCFGGRREPVRQVVLQVRNDHALDVDVYGVRRGGLEIRLGTVVAHDSAELDFPDTFRPPVDLRFRLNPIGSSDTYLTESLPLAGGEIVLLRVASSLPLSTVSLR